jgi:hypothetical protein
LQDRTWSAVVENVISLSGGRAPAGVQQERHSLDDEEAAAIQHWLEEVTMQRKRAENAEKIAASG